MMGILSVLLVFFMAAGSAEEDMEKPARENGVPNVSSIPAFDSDALVSFGVGRHKGI